MAIFKGAGVAIVTPMKENLEINYDKLDEIIEEQIAGGTDAIIICGTTGESATMTEAEHSEAIRFAIERVNHRIPVIAGTGSNCTRTAIELSREAEKDGADGLLLVTPYYNKATQNGLIAHYTQICNEVQIPAILYNVPSRTGCSIQPQTLATLVKNVDNIVGIKDAVGDVSYTAQLMYETQGDIPGGRMFPCGFSGQCLCRDTFRDTLDRDILTDRLCIYHICDNICGGVGRASVHNCRTLYDTRRQIADGVCLQCEESRCGGGLCLFRGDALRFRDGAGRDIRA